MAVHRFKKFDLRAARKLLPIRRKSDHKATAGHALIIAGSKGMLGAAILSATAASRIGAGYVHLMMNETLPPVHRYPDFLTTAFSVSTLQKKIAGGAFSAIAIGPGLGVGAGSTRMTSTLRKLAPQAVVIDADALNIASKKGWSQLPETWVMTPHEGELARLLKCSASTVRENRRAAVLAACERFGCIVLLKGHRTLVASPDGRCFEIQSGNAALAKAGTGDVLTGMITGLRAQGLPGLEAACLAAFLHGKVADDWLKTKRDILSLMASDILSELPRTLARVRGTSRR